MVILVFSKNIAHNLIYIYPNGVGILLGLCQLYQNLNRMWCLRKGTFLDFGTVVIGFLGIELASICIAASSIQPTRLRLRSCDGYEQLQEAFSHRKLITCIILFIGERDALMAPVYLVECGNCARMCLRMWLTLSGAFWDCSGLTIYVFGIELLTVRMLASRIQSTRLRLRPPYENEQL